jgi:hypothetical protein
MDMQQYLADVSLRTMSRVHRAVVHLSGGQASAAEKAELWPRVVAAYQGYGGYQRRTERDIPLVILEAR